MQQNVVSKSRVRDSIANVANNLAASVNHNNSTASLNESLKPRESKTII
jgi:hypothetical protein